MSDEFIKIEKPHIPVMMDEVLAYLEPSSGKTYVDATLGAGGHALAVLKRIQPDGHLIGFDQDAGVLEKTGDYLGSCQYKDGEELTLIHCNFSFLESELDRINQKPITGGILADIGVSSIQLDEGERGFSFSKEADLDMRMDKTNPKTAQDVVNSYSEKELVRIFSEYGEERFSKTIARRIVEARKNSVIRTTVELADLILGINRQIKRDLLKDKSPNKKSRIHPATRVFQALRIEVNDELGHLERFLESLPNCMAGGARVVVISFHSLEDRLVKRAFRNFKKEGLFDVLTPKPLRALEEEIKINPRSRSARLRAAVKL